VALHFDEYFLDMTFPRILCLDRQAMKYGAAKSWALFCLFFLAKMRKGLLIIDSSVEDKTLTNLAEVVGEAAHEP